MAIHHSSSAKQHRGHARRSRHAGGQPRPWRWLALAALVLAIGGALMIVGRGANQTNGRLAAEHVAHDFGKTPIGGGLIVARFPLQVQGATLVTYIGTS